MFPEPVAVTAVAWTLLSLHNMAMVPLYVPENASAPALAGADDGAGVTGLVAMATGFLVDHPTAHLGFALLTFLTAVPL